MPDFAFPTKVSDDALESLDRGMAAHDGPAVVKALIDFTVARMAVDSDSLTSVMEVIDRAQSQMTDVAAAAMIDLLKARIFRDVYSSDRYTFDRRTLPLTPLPDNIMEWSGSQFRERIYRLCRSAVSRKDRLVAVPLKTYSTVIKSGSSDNATGGTAYVYYPTLYDFVASSAIELTQGFVDSYSLYRPAQMLATDAIITPTDSVAQFVSDTYASLIEVNPRVGAPLIHTRLGYLDYISGHTLWGDVSLATARCDALRSLYDEYSSSEYSGDILNGIYDAPVKWMYSALTSFLKSHPAYYDANSLRNRLNELTRPSADVRVKGSLAPGEELQVRVNVRSASEVTLALYELTSPSILTDSWITLSKTPHRLVGRYTRHVEGTTPFDTAIVIPVGGFTRPGYYVMVPELPGVATEPAGSAPVIHCTRVASGLFRFTTTELVALDPLTGSPCGGAEVWYNPRSGRSSTFSRLGTADSDGFMALPAGKRGNYIAVRGTDHYGEAVYAMPESLPGKRGDGERSEAGAIYPALGLVRPGDTLEVAAVAYIYDRAGRRVLAGVPLSLILTDVNGENVDTIQGVSDGFGRINGVFSIPEGRLTGDYRISLTRSDEPGRRIATRYVTVSDYKLPSYRVEIEGVLMSSPSAGDVTIKGRVATYSGFGMGDVSLTMKLSVSRGFWWWRGNGSQELSDEPVDVESDGRFSIVIPAPVFASSPYPKGSYTAEFKATSAAGESRSASRRFSLAQAYAIRADIPASIEISKPVRLNVKVFDSEEKAVEATLAYEFFNDTDTLRGALVTSDPVVDLSSLSVGEYSLRLTACGNIADDCLPFMSDADDRVDDLDSLDGEIALYRRDCKVSPSTDLLWTPERSFTAERGGEVEILFGLPAQTASQREERGKYHVYYILSADEKIVERRWMELDEGLHTLRVTMPDAPSATVGLYATRDYSSSNCEFTLTSVESKRRLTILRESFRDRLVPGEAERWVMHVVCGDDTAVSAAAIADMYNRALDAITPSSDIWSLIPETYRAASPVWRSPALTGLLFPSVYGKVKYLRTHPLILPVLNTYGYPLYSGNGMSYMYRKSALSAVRVRGSVARAESDDMVVEESFAMEAPAMGVAMSNAMMKTEATFDAEDAVEEESEAVITDAADGGAVAEASSDNFAYRDSETPLAFFRPSLSTGSDGRITIEFTAPNANASWSFNLLAWTERMITGSTQIDVTASKPIMVQPNLPRFLRTGDTVTLKAMVMNNTDSTCTATTEVELFDPASGAALQSPESRVVSLDAGASQIVETAFEVPGGISLVGYRVKASTDGFADGEQTAIRVLPASQPIVETQPFYIAPGREKMEMKIPDLSDDSRVTLEYCANPLWYVVTALPGLSADKPSTAVEAAVGIFSTAVARGLLRDNPSLAEAVKQWSASDQSDSTLVSMLERNADLNTVLLQATPWMMDARSDTERMTRLTLLFDSRRCDTAIRECVDMLSTLCGEDGGWGWTPQFARTSEWVSYCVLDKLAGLSRLGYMPSDRALAEMIRGAIEYIDRRAAADFARYPQGDYLSYTVLRSLFPDVPQSQAARHVSEVTVQRIIASWKDYDVRTKALAVLILSAKGYPSVASQVMASIRDFAVVSPEKGMWWPSAGNGGYDQLVTTARVLDAMVAVNPESPDVDAVRQWMIYQKEARDWGDGATATSVIASILTSSSRRIAPAVMPVIKVGRHRVDTSGASARLGYLRTDLSGLHPSGATLSVSRPADGLTPAWGAVYEQRVVRMDSIPAQSCEAVSVTRRITPLDGGDSLTIGDRVRVQIVLTVSDAMDYVAITDERAACLEPVDQLPGYIFAEGLGFYRENLDSSTRIFIDHLPKGTYILSYEMYVAQAGRFASGVATVQSQYAPSRTAHSASSPIVVGE